MRRFFRWQLVLPRLLLVIVSLLAVQFALGLAVRSLVVRSGEAAVGARIELATARVAPLDRQIVLGDLRVANPFRPDDNLLQAERCELDFALRPLLHKQAIIERGRLTGLRVGSQRDAPDNAAAEPAPANDWFRDDSDETAREWLAALHTRFERGLADRLEAVDRIEELHVRLPEQSAAVDERASKLRHRAAALQQASEIAQANRLRNAAFFHSLPEEIAALRREFAELTAEVEELPQTVAAERRAIAEVLRRDEAALRERLRLEPIDDDALSTYLLRQQVIQPLEELIGWLRWASQTRRAEAAQPAPSFLIRALQLHGETRFGGQPVAFTGLLTGVASGTAAPGQPMRLRIVGTGPLPLELHATIDRTGGAPRGELLLDCRGIKLPELNLGRADQLQISLGPSVASLLASLRVVGEELSGDIQFVQNEVRITPALHGELAALPLAAPLQATLAGASSVATRLELHGTIDKPACTLWSNLGPAVAEALERATRHSGDAYARATLAEAQRRIDARFAEIERQLTSQQSQLASQLTVVASQLDTIAAGQTRQQRISAERLGDNLPANSLFR